MGTWGIGNLENDGALDWLQDFSDEPKVIKFNSAFLLIMDNQEYIEATDCEEALAAAEVLAALNGKPCTDFPEEDLAMIQNSGILFSADLADMAINAIEKIKANSELKELWEDSEDVLKWIQVLNDLEKRLE